MIIPPNLAHLIIVQWLGTFEVQLSLKNRINTKKVCLKISTERSKENIYHKLIDKCDYMILIHISEGNVKKPPKKHML